MICPNCHAEYRDGFTRCADCEVALVDDLANVPAAASSPDEESAEEFFASAAGRGVAADGEPGGLAPLAELSNPEILGTLLEQFEEAQIPYVVQAGTAMALARGKELESDGFPDPWQAGILVLASFKPQARQMLDAIVAAEKKRALDARAASLPV
ncbi:MAG: hypothetical protein ABI639_10850 [Thermoanaerobaculia bacterium]